MGKYRLKAFSDGVLAIIITIMVLELEIPGGQQWNDLVSLLPIFLSYVLSFTYVGIYWNNHHHLLHTAHKVTGPILWANLHLLFWLSLFPFSSGWMGQNHLAQIPSVFYGLVLLMASIAYFILQKMIIHAEGGQSTLKRAIGRDWKGKMSIFSYMIGMGVALAAPWIAQLIYVGLALLWLVPDRRIERALTNGEDEKLG